MDDDMIKISALAYAELLDKLNTVYFYILGQMEKIRQDEDTLLVDLYDASLYLGMSTRTLRRRIKAGKIPAYQRDNKYLLTIGDLKDALKANIIKLKGGTMESLIKNHKYYGRKRADTSEDQ